MKDLKRIFAVNFFDKRMKFVLLPIVLLPFMVVSQQLTPPVISHQSGFYADEFYLQIAHPDTNVTILYTLDGSEPKIENLTGKVWNYKKQYPTNPGDGFGTLLEDTIWTFEYIDSVLIKDRTNDRDLFADISTSYYTNQWYNHNSKPDSVNVFKGAGIRVSAYLNGVYSSVVTKNYFVSPLGANRYSLPVTCLNVDPEIFFGYENGLNVPGIKFDDWRTTNPTEFITSVSPGNFRASGSSSEIPIHLSYLVNNQEVLNHGAGLRLHGNGSRVFPNRSFRLYAKSSYGASSFQYPFFEDYSQNSFKRIIFRNSGNDCVSTMFRDGLIQSTVKNLNFETQEYQPVIVFINAEYFGIYNIRERFDDKYFEQKYGINVNDLDYIENDGIVEEGDAQAYNQLMSFLENNDISIEENFRTLKTKVDLNSFTDFFVTEIFINNSDWPHNNNEFWRKRVIFDSTASYGHDGRFRWVIKDLDISFGHEYGNIASEDNFERLLYIINDTTHDRSTLLLRKLLENNSYKEYFINRFFDLLNTNFKPDRLVSLINLFSERIDPEIAEFSERWSPQQSILTHFYPLYNKTAWYESVDKMRDFAEDRTFYQVKNLKKHFTDTDVDIIINTSDINHGTVQINTIEINENTVGINQIIYPWSGTYFKNVPVKLKAIAKNGYVFSHWSGEINDTLPEISVKLNNDTYIKANFVLEPSDEISDLSVNNIASNLNEITVYPNPFSDNINILLDEYNGHYYIYTIDGKLQMDGVLNSKTINLESLDKGVFILEVKTNNQVFTKRILKK